MLEKYGLQSSVASGSYNIAREPLYFVRSGYIALDYGSLRDNGRRGDEWSSVSTTYSSNFRALAYNLLFTDLGIFPSDGPLNRWGGFPVRCLV